MGIRAFIAVPLPNEVKESIHSLGRELVESGLRLRLVRPEGIHCTLRFLGDIPESLVEGVGDAMEEAARGMSSVSFETGGIGVFPNPLKARVIWVGVKGNIAALETLYQRLQNALKPLGFQRERRGFSPHLTMGRWRSPLNASERELLKEAIHRHKEWRGGGFDLREMVLYRSQLQPSGAKYTPLYRVKIGER